MRGSGEAGEVLDAGIGGGGGWVLDAGIGGTGSSRNGGPLDQGVPLREGQFVPMESGD